MKFKRELAFGANDIHRSHGYHRLLDPVFKLDQIVRNLIDRETYVDNGICQLACDFVKRSIIVFDVIGKKYSVFRHRPSVSSDSDNEIGPAYLLINYNGAYSPCIYVDTHNNFDGQALATELAKQYEHVNQDMYILNNKDTEPKGPKKPERSANAEPRLDLLIKKVEDRERERKVTIVTECPMNRPPTAATESTTDNSNQVEPVTGTTNAGSKQELGPLKNYTLEQLQALATQHGVEITRPNAKGTPVRKTKQVLYDELFNCMK
jgi:hypothetical protein